MEERVINVDYGDEMRKAYIDYSMSVITARALPDVRDGLKPVHRRILYAMKQLNLEPTGPFRKSARIVGDCLGKYHPHGDSSVYDAMVRLSQPFNMSMPLISGQGNFGSIDGDGAAAMRYTEAKLHPLANELLSNLEKGLVDFAPNFDNSLTEPVVLPAKFPNLLVNGAMGIAVGMSTSIPPHNINEVIKATLKLIDDPALSLKQLMKIIKGPDFPTGGIISNQDELYDIYATGAGKIKVRAKMEIEDMGYGKNAIIITEIPYTLSGSKSKLIEDIAALIVDKKLPEASDIRDESSREGMRIVIETKKGTNLEIFKNKLLKMTKLEDTFGVNLLALSQNKPIVFNLKQLLEEYIAFLKETTLKRINYELKKATDKFEVLDGLISAIDVIDLIIEIIRNSKDVASVRACLIQGETGNIGFKTKKSENEAKKLKFSERQADAILSMQLQRLVGLELEKLKEEAMNTERDIVFYRDLIKYEKKFNEYMKEDLERINQAYKVKRRTELSNLEIGEMEEEIKEENLYALLDNNNYLKIIDSQSFSRAATETLSDFRIVPITNMEKLGIFDWDGNLHSIKIGELPVSKINDKGQPLENLTKKSSIRVLNMINLTKSNRENLNLLFVTRAGLVKRVPASEYETNRTTISATKINNNGDFLIDVKLLEPEHHEILLTTKEKRTLRFLLDEIPVLKKNSLGVTGMNINAYDDLEKVFIDGKTKEAKRKRGSKGKI